METIATEIASNMTESKKYGSRVPIAAIFARAESIGILLLSLFCIAGCTSRAIRTESTTSAPPKHDSRPEAMVIGTIHKGHLLQPEYPLGLLSAAIDEFQPDLVLVEIRPEAFRNGFFEDGPFEMTFVAEYARARGIPVEPIDWWLDNDSSAEQQFDSANVAKLEQTLSELEFTPWPSFSQVHAISSLEREIVSQNARARYLNGNASWNRRQSWMNHQAITAIRKHDARRTLAFVGYSHLPELEMYLAAFRVDIIDRLPSLEQFDSSSLNRPVSAEVVELWRNGLIRLREKAAAADEATRAKILAKIRYFEVAIERRGVCCVSEKDLQPR